MIAPAMTTRTVLPSIAARVLAQLGTAAPPVAEASSKRRPIKKATPKAAIARKPQVGSKITALLRNDPAVHWKRARIIARFDLTPRHQHVPRYQALTSEWRRDPAVSERLIDQARASILGARATRARVTLASA
jgi:hypothetical protein